ncbi:alanine racemase family protein (ISS) [Stemphylium lycopersici]|uniref:Pyridoxal phosphate homeostasis protein n=1 Tax=Stemphylium lycopersici TaxID=183478 RepID=A0A364MUP1_STELY|nr:alanine racemase family protein (ISS) [Stemphylium lycopersici]
MSLSPTCIGQLPIAACGCLVAWQSPVQLKSCEKTTTTSPPLTVIHQKPILLVSSNMGALEFICDRKFHKSLILPADPEAGRNQQYRTTYADFGDVNSNAVVLFCGALFGQRLCYSPLDQLAKKHHVRIIHPDRPGVGGSEPVEPEKRIQTWLGWWTPLLFKASSLHSQKWYPNSWRISTYLMSTQLLPASMIGKFGSLGKFVNQTVVPLAGLSGAFVHGISGPLLRPNATAAPVALPASPTSDTERPSGSSTGEILEIRLDDPQVVEELRKHIMKLLYAENVDGVSHDTQLFLRRSVQWNAPGVDWNDFDDAVKLLARRISEEDGTSRVWAIDCFQAEQDQLTGEKGKKWFNDIWVPSQSYTFRSEDVKGTEHNFLMDPAFGASERWLQRRVADPRREHHHSPSPVMAEDMRVNPQRAKQLAENVSSIISRIDAASKGSKQVRLIAVSKLKPANDILALHQPPDPTQTHFGENYVQELLEKAKILPRTIQWHMIGGLQSNKCKQLAEQIPNLWCVSSVDSEKKAHELEKGRKVLLEKDASAEKLRIKVQVNTSGEENKSGVEPQDTLALCRYIIDKCPHLQLAGLMTIGAIARSMETTPENENEDFVTLRETRDKVAKELGWEEGRLELSMGMSADFEGAIRMGSDEVRVGSNLFGERPQKKDAVIKEKEAEEKS